MKKTTPASFAPGSLSVGTNCTAMAPTVAACATVKTRQPAANELAGIPKTGIDARTTVEPAADFRKRRRSVCSLRSHLRNGASHEASSPGNRAGKIAIRALCFYLPPRESKNIYHRVGKN